MKILNALHCHRIVTCLIFSATFSWMIHMGQIKVKTRAFHINTRLKKKGFGANELVKKDESWEKYES